MNLSAGGTMVLEAPAPKRPLRWRNAPPGRWGCVSPRWTCLRRSMEIPRDQNHRGEFEPVDPAAGGLRQRRSDPENLASHLFRDGTSLVFDLPKYGDGVCLARLADLLDVLGIDRARLQRTSRRRHRIERQGQHRGVLREHRPRPWTADRTVHLAASVSLQRAVSGRWHPIEDGTLARLVAQIEFAIAEVSQRRNEKFGAFEALFALACLHFQQSDCDFAVFEAGIGGRYDPVRLVGARFTCVTSVDYRAHRIARQFAGLIVSDKSDACAAGGTIIYGENCRGLRRHLADYNRTRDVTNLFVRDEIRIGNEVASATAQRFDFQFGDHDFRSLEMSLLGSFQFNNAAIAIALFLLWPGQARPGEIAASDRSRRAIGPPRHALARPARGHCTAPLTVIDVGHTPDGIRQSLASLKAIHGAEGWILVVGVRATRRPMRSWRCWRRRSIPSSAPARIIRARTPRRSRRRRGRQIRQPQFMSRRRSRTPCSSARTLAQSRVERFSWPADCSSPSNTPPPRRAGSAGSGVFLTSSFRDAPRRERGIPNSQIEVIVRASRRPAGASRNDGA